MSRRSRSQRNYLLELAVVAVLVAVIYLWLMNGGPTAFGKWFAEVIGAP